MNTIPQGTTFYEISGEMCYDYFTNAFVGSYTVEGQLRVKLDWINPTKVDYEVWHYMVNPNSGMIIINETRSGSLINHMDADGNFTPFFTEIPCPMKENLYTMTESVEAYYMGERYIEFNGKFIRTHWYCYTLAELYAIYRCEWYFEWDSGILLHLVKSITVNLIPVQWIEYKLANTTLSLTEGHPINAFFVNQQANFYAGVGAAVIVSFLFFFLIQRKVQRDEIV
ncbi:MAG: hypothetical protein ACTSQQ_17145 [Candidatus Helarchaeota archaeon]